MVKSKVFTSNINNRFDVSVVIPLLDEEESLVELFEKISHTMKRLRRRFEVVFVDDGSSDNSFKVIKALHMKHPSLVQAIRFRRNYGKSAALTAGFQASRAGDDTCWRAIPATEKTPERLQGFPGMNPGTLTVFR